MSRLDANQDSEGVAVDQPIPAIAESDSPQASFVNEADDGARRPRKVLLHLFDCEHCGNHGAAPKSRCRTFVEQVLPTVSKWPNRIEYALSHLLGFVLIWALSMVVDLP